MAKHPPTLLTAKEEGYVALGVVLVGSFPTSFCVGTLEDVFLAFAAGFLPFLPDLFPFGFPPLRARSRAEGIFFLDVLVMVADQS